MGQVPSDLVERIDKECVQCVERAVTPPNADGADTAPNAVSTITQNAHELVTGLPAIWDALKNSQGVGIDDRKLLLEHALTFMAQTSESPCSTQREISKQLESFVLDFLYKDLPHPPSGYVSLPKNTVTPAKYRDVTYAYRTADGSNYNTITPTLGMAGTPYARSVPSTHPLPPSFLPDAGLVFDTLLKRDEFVPHPGGVSSLFFAFADLVIHSIFNTNGQDPSLNSVSSYLDLSPLYGSSDKDVASVRRKDGTGRLWNDVFADRRLLFMPPSACALLVLLCRNHNYIAQKILSINEQGTFKSPGSLDEKTRLAQDDEIFERSRLVNCGFFMQIILGDYVGAILGLVRDGHSWRLPVLEPIRESDHSVSPCGQGNVVSVEFNLMYRWHTTLSQPDTQWVEQKFEQLFSGKPFDQLTRNDFGALYKDLSQIGDVKTWTFSNLKRSSNGRFENAALAKILHEATAASASAFKARGIPEALRVVEVMGIEQARKWGTCSLNEFRKFMGLKPYASFESWNPDPSVYTAAQALYSDIDNLELYVGLQAEEPKTPGPGAGLCPGYTMSRAILADAVCLTRGDPFMTTEFTPQNFTAWGYQDCQFQKDDGSYGGMLTKLLFRTLPEFYPADSAYAHFPFMVPERMREYMEKRGASDAVKEYSWTRPQENASLRLFDCGLHHQRERYEQRLRDVVDADLQNILKSEQCVLISSGDEGFIRPSDGPVLQSLDVLLNDDEFELWSARMSRIVVDLLQTKAFAAGDTKFVDIVRSVINLAPVQWIVEEFGFDEDIDKYYAGNNIEHLYEMFSQIAHYIYINTSPEQEFVLRNSAKEATSPILRFIMNKLQEADAQDAPYTKCLRSLRTARGSSDPHISAAFVGDVAATAAIFSRVVVQILDRLLCETKETVATLLNDSASGNEAMERYVRGALAIVDEGGIRHGLMNERFFVAIAPAILRSVLALDHIQRAPGKSGELHGLVDDSHSIASCRVLYLNPQGQLSPWPCSMLLQFDNAC